MNALVLAETILTFAAIVGVGALLRATGLLRAEDARPLNTVIIYVGLPAFIFKAVHGAAIVPGMARVVAIAWIVFATTAAVAWVATRMLRLRPRVAGAFILVSALGNTGYIGYPLVQSLLGEKALAEAVFYDIFGTVFALVLVGLFVAERFGHGEGAPVNPLRELLTFPAVIALAVALATRTLAVPEPVSHGLELLASIVAPLIMMSVGLSLRPRSLGENRRALVGAALLRLVFAPLVALSAGALLAGGDATLRVAVMEAGMPSMMLTLIVGERFGLDTEFIASAIFVTTVLSALTLPLGQLLA